MTLPESTSTVLAHGAGGGGDELFLMVGIGTLAFGAMKLADKSRSRGKRLIGLPLIILGVAVGAAPFVFRFGDPEQAKTRIASPATVKIAQPTAGAAVRGDVLQLQILVDGARIVDKVSTNLKPTEGHLHLSIDGRQYQMNIREFQRVDISDLDPGQHLLEIEFAATDHGSFEPPVRAVTPFRVEK